MAQRRPDTYTSVNTNTQRTGLPIQGHEILFMTVDEFETQVPNTPTKTYVGAGFADDSHAKRMIDAALKVNQGVDMSVCTTTVVNDSQNTQNQQVSYMQIIT